jgi:hypothetical protein
MTRRATTTIGTTTATAIVPPVPNPLLFTLFPEFCSPAVDAPDEDDDVAVPVFVEKPPP